MPQGADIGTRPGVGVELRRFGPWRRELRAFLELVALTGVALAQPALDLLSKNAALFITLLSTKLETVALSLIVVLVPPTSLWVLEVIVGLVVPRLRRWAHAAISAGIAAILAVEALKKQTDLAPIPLIAAAVVVGIAAGALILRFDVVRLWLRYLAIAPAIFVVIFLFASPVTAVVFENGDAPSANVHIGKPNRIVMIVLDELPLESILDGNGHVDSALFPNFAALASTSTWFRNDTTVAPYTDLAVPAILSGGYPTGTNPPVTAEYPHNLFTFLGGSYQMNVHESVTRLCPTGTCARQGSATTLGNRFQELLHTTYSLWWDFASPKRRAPTLNPGRTHSDLDPVRTGSSFVRSIQPSDRPQLDFLHILLPHQPWHVRAGGQDDGYLGPDPGMLIRQFWPNTWNATAGRQRHLLQVQAADQLVGDVIAKLKRIGAYKDSVIVVTADHGVSFAVGSSYRGLSNQNYPEILWTPLFVRLPGQTTGRVDDHPVRSIDVLPTIADAIDTKLPWKVDGHSMFTPSRAGSPPRAFDWILNQVHPPSGQSFLTFPEAGFASALAGRASAATGAADLRLYRIGPFGSLIGRPAKALVSSSSDGPAGTLDHSGTWDDVDPRAASIPWAFVQGQLTAPNGAPLAITVNGVIAGMSEAYVEQPGKQAKFWSSLPPQLFRRGHNTIGVDLIIGTPAAPQLVPVRLRP
jgi:hypothetical protein